MFSPRHYAAMKYAVGPRKAMATRTIFNLLGPLTNPANATCQVMGVCAKEWVRLIVEVLKALGSKHVMVVHSADGLDELSLGVSTYMKGQHPGEKLAELFESKGGEYLIMKVEVIWQEDVHFTDKPSSGFKRDLWNYF